MGLIGVTVRCIIGCAISGVHGKLRWDRGGSTGVRSLLPNFNLLMRLPLPTDAKDSVGSLGI